jgi:hypothetical protein
MGELSAEGMALLLNDLIHAYRASLVYGIIHSRCDSLSQVNAGKLKTITLNHMVIMLGMNTKRGL